MSVYVAVCGPADATEEERSRAEEVGRRLAESGAVVVCGGLGGVMDAAAMGARDAGGIAVGVHTTQFAIRDRIVYVIEVNPNCYLERESEFARAAARSGLDYDALIARIVELAAARYAR